MKWRSLDREIPCCCLEILLYDDRLGNYLAARTGHGSWCTRQLTEHGKGKCFTNWSGICLDNYTHWMPLPSKPHWKRGCYTCIRDLFLLHLMINPEYSPFITYDLQTILEDYTPSIYLRTVL